MAGASGQAAGGGYEIERSLRFNDADDASLSFTPSSAGNRKTWTWSSWVKLNNDGYGNLFANLVNNNNGFYVYWASGIFYISDYNTSGGAGLNTTRLFRDFSSWYHIVIVMDSTQATASDRVKLYINGVQETLAGSQPNQHVEGKWNAVQTHYIGQQTNNVTDYNLDGYLADVHFVDGQGLAASDFGEFDNSNAWQPKKFAGTYGTNGFYLDFSDNSSNSALGTDSSGNGNDWTVNNLTANINTISSPNSPGWSSAGSNWSVSNSNQNANYSGSSSYSTQLAATLSNNTTYHFFLEQYAGSGDSYGGWFFSTDSSEGGTVPNELNDNTLGMRVGESSIGAHGTYATANSVSNGSSALSGFSTIQSNTSGGAATTTEFVINTSVDKVWVRPVGGSWIGGGDPSNTSSTGSFNIVSASTQYFGFIAYNSGTYAKFKTSTGNASDLDSLRDSPTNGTQSDTGAGGEVIGNYATWNSANHQSTTKGYSLTNGNLDATYTGGTTYSSGQRGFAVSTIGMTSGKWFFELTVNSVNNDDHAVGIANQDGNGYYAPSDSSWTYRANGKKYIVGTTIDSDYGAAFETGDVIGVAFDADAGSISCYKNGQSQGVLASGLPAGTYFFVWGGDSGSNTWSVSANFGQRSWAYSAPSGYKALCTANLPDPTIADGSTAFDAKLWTGNGSSQDITGYSNSPDLVWIKKRSSTSDHALFDTVRGATKRLYPNDSSGEDTLTNTLTSFDSAGYGLGSANDVNQSSETYVGWAWDAGSSNTSIAAGSLNSSLYDQSQTWSSGTFFDDNGYSFYNSSGSAAQIFDNVETGTGSTGDYPLPVLNGTFKLTFTQFSSATSVTVQYEGNGNGLKINGSFVTLPSSSGTATFSVSGLTSIEWLYTSSAYCYLGSIAVDGVKLVDSGVSVANVPSIASTVRANPSTGFSIVTWNFSSSLNKTIGHGLNAAPELYFIKNRDATEDWFAYTTAIDGGLDYAYLNSSDAFSSSSRSLPTSSVFNYDGTTGDHVAYCFAPVEGYSAFGKYTGNGSSDGPFVYTGFKVAFLLLKRTDSSSSWRLFDTERETHNVQDALLFPNESSAETESSNYNTDILSNGFKLRTSNTHFNASGGTFVYLAFASHPFKTARAR